jgi:hypothetical protein
MLIHFFPPATLLILRCESSPFSSFLNQYMKMSMLMTPEEAARMHDNFRIYFNILENKHYVKYELM